MLLTVKDLKIQFRHDEETVKAVDGISFEIAENEVMGLVGESGSGKTVTALSLMNLLPERSSWVSGEITKNAKTAMIFQEPFTSLNPVLRAGEQIDEACNICDFQFKVSPHRDTLNGKLQTLQKQTLALLKKVKIQNPERIYNSYPHQLSGGERQRVMIAMALGLNPELLIADEPTTALDVTIQKEILELMLSLKNELKISVLFITHDFGIINKVADRVLVMKDGKIVERGKKQDILSSPKDDYTKKLLAAVPKISIKENEERIESTKSVITLKGLCKSFPVDGGIFRKEHDRVRAVRDVSFEIKEGKTLGLVGESGSGKTTLGKLVMNLLEADSGEITAERKIMQIVFQDPQSSLDPRMRIEDIVLEGPTIKGVKKLEKDKILRDVLFKVRLNYKDRLKYPHQFSGGERQRIAIARALAVNPQILILDEPVSSLDVIIQSDILDLLKGLQKELSLTYIFISHDLRVVRDMSDEIAVMYNGEIVEFGSRYQIYNSPKHPYTKQLLSSILL